MYADDNLIGLGVLLRRLVTWLVTVAPCRWARAWGFCMVNHSYVTC